MSDPVKDIAYGAAAGCLGKIIEFPFDTVKVRLQTTHHTSTIKVIRSIFKKEGLFSFYKGIKAPLLGSCLESAVLFSAFQLAQDSLKTSSLIRHDELLGVSVSGAFSGFAASFILTPVELVKCNLQVANESTRPAPSARPASSGKPAPISAPMASYSSVIRSILQKQGIPGLWHGLSSTLLREMAGTAVWFATYELALHHLRQVSPSTENSNLLVSGATAGFMFNLSIYPIDTIKSNIQTSHSSDLFHVGKMLINRNGGVRNLYSGLSVTLIRSIPANAVIFYSYEWLKKNY